MDDGKTEAGVVLEGRRVALLDSQAIEEGRQAALARSHIGATTQLAEKDGASEPVTPEIVAARLTVLEETRATMLDDLAVVQGKIDGLREILAASAANEWQSEGGRLMSDSGNVVRTGETEHPEPESQPGGQDRPDPTKQFQRGTEPSSSVDRDEDVDEALEDSFPASDPPSTWTADVWPT